jgi:hypothetical protein
LPLGASRAPGIDRRHETLLRPLSALLLSLTLVVTAGAMGAARGQAQVAGQIVICTGQGVVTVSVDENGAPTGPAHICPDCALGFFDVAAGNPAQPDRALVPSELGRLPEPPRLAAAAGQTPRARAPPLT